MLIIVILQVHSRCIHICTAFTTPTCSPLARGLVFASKDSSFGGLEVPCWPLVTKFAGSNPAEAVGFFRSKKSSARLPSEGK